MVAARCWLDNALDRVAGVRPAGDTLIAPGIMLGGRCIPYASGIVADIIVGCWPGMAAPPIMDMIGDTVPAADAGAQVTPGVIIGLGAPHPPLARPTDAVVGAPIVDHIPGVDVSVDVLVELAIGPPVLIVLLGL